MPGGGIIMSHGGKVAYRKETLTQLNNLVAKMKSEGVLKEPKFEKGADKAGFAGWVAAEQNYMQAWLVKNGASDQMASKLSQMYADRIHQHARYLRYKKYKSEGLAPRPAGSEPLSPTWKSTGQGQPLPQHSVPTQAQKELIAGKAQPKPTPTPTPQPPKPAEPMPPPIPKGNVPEQAVADWTALVPGGKGMSAEEAYGAYQKALAARGPNNGAALADTLLNIASISPHSSGWKDDANATAGILIQHLGLKGEEALIAPEIVHKWTQSSNNSPEMAAAHLAAAQHFGQQLSAFEQQKAQVFGSYTSAQLSTAQKLTPQIYANTQKWLTIHGMADDGYVVLFRGVKNQATRSPGEKGIVSGNVLESWSTRLPTAQAFGQYMKARVPRERIFSVMQTGYGTASEHEVVVLGREPLPIEWNVNSQAPGLYEMLDEEGLLEQGIIIQEGGPGSGNWGHRGRPGQRGGSMPGGGHGAVGAGAVQARKEKLEQGSAMLDGFRDMIGEEWAEWEKLPPEEVAQGLRFYLSNFVGDKEAGEYAQLYLDRAKAHVSYMTKRARRVGVQKPQAQGAPRIEGQTEPLINAPAEAVNDWRSLVPGWENMNADQAYAAYEKALKARGGSGAKELRDGMNEAASLRKAEAAKQGNISETEFALQHTAKLGTELGLSKKDAEALGFTASEWAESAVDSGAVQALRKGVAEAFGLPLSQYEQMMMGDSMETASPQMLNVARQAAPKVYARTQEWLTEQGVPDDGYVTLFRGVQGYDDAKVGGHALMQGSSIESWTTQPATASVFGSVMKARIPRERLFAVAETGFGTWGEREVLVLGRRELPVEWVSAYSTDPALLEARPLSFDLREGGPGSGNWGHRGRPGQRGGSMPGGGHGAVGAGIVVARKENLQTLNNAVAAINKAIGPSFFATSMDDQKGTIKGFLTASGLSDAEAQQATNFYQARAKAHAAYLRRKTAQAGSAGQAQTDYTSTPFAQQAASGTAKIVGTSDGGINESLKVEMADGSRGIWKAADPTEGKVNWGDPTKNQHRGEGEVATYRVAEMLGQKGVEGMTGLVPETVWMTMDRDGKQVRGTVQKWVDNTRIGEDITDAEISNKAAYAQGVAMLVLDNVVGNGDRHNENWLVQNGTGKIVAIDHGHAFFGEHRARLKPSYVADLFDAPLKDGYDARVTFALSDNYPQQVRQTVMQLKGVTLQDCQKAVGDIGGRVKPQDVYDNIQYLINQTESQGYGE